jgi:hypothetical protein
MSDNPQTPPEAEPEPQPPESFPGLAEILDRGRALPWTSIDLACPPAAVESIGAEIDEASAVLTCDCGQRFRLHLTGEYPQRCPGCKATFRHLVAIQHEDRYPSAVSAIMPAILEAQRKG